MKCSKFNARLVLLTLGAVALAWFWALPPLLTPLAYLYPTDWTDADLVRHLWRFRLVAPEWVGPTPDYLRWALAETLARLTVVFLGWLTGTTFLTRKYSAGHKGLSPNQHPAAIPTLRHFMGPQLLRRHSWRLPPG